MSAALVTSLPAFLTLGVEHPALASFSQLPAFLTVSSIPATLIWFTGGFDLGDSAGFSFVDSFGNLISP